MKREHCKSSVEVFYKTTSTSIAIFNAKIYIRIFLCEICPISGA